MNLTSLSSADFKQIAKLLEKKEVLLAGVAQIDRELSSFDGGSAKGLGRPVRLVTGVQRQERGKVKEAIISLVQGAGKAGITVREIASRLDVPSNRVYTWFHTTGKNVKSIKKVGKAQYAWVG